MCTVQLAIANQRYATALAAMLQRDGSHNAVLVEKPGLDLGGIIVIDLSKQENLMLCDAHPERIVVVVQKGAVQKDAGLLSFIWDAGVRHVVFEEDSPNTAMLAIFAAELRAPQLIPAASARRAFTVLRS